MDITDILYAKKLSSGSGGGGGDFTIANVTITTEGYNYSLPALFADDDREFTIALTGGESGEFQVPLYKGNAVFMTLEPLIVTVTGDIAPLIEGEVYLITGDGTITLSE